MKRIATLPLLLLTFCAVFGQPGDNTISISKPLYFPVDKKLALKVGDRTVVVTISQYGDRGSTVCINLHDNEGTSVEAARSVMEEVGGTLIKIENGKQRVIKFRLKGVTYGFDPNRMFSKIGIEQTLRDNRRYSREASDAVAAFASQVLALIPDSAGCIVALHNNTEEAFSVKSYLPGHERERDARAVYADSLQDVDDIVFTTDSLLYARMADHGYNSIWQDNNKAKKDGSLSIYFGEKNRRYINIETQHGRVDQYREMFGRLLAILEAEKTAVPESDPGVTTSVISSSEK